MQQTNKKPAAKRIYIAGPMTGYPEFNYPAFNAEAARLRELGYYVANPAENPVPRCGSWQGYMRMAIAQLVTCDAVVTLPNWRSSNGAHLEVVIATRLHLAIFKEGEIKERMSYKDFDGDHPAMMMLANAGLLEGFVPQEVSHLVRDLASGNDYSVTLDHSVVIAKARQWKFPLLHATLSDGGVVALGLDATPIDEQPVCAAENPDWDADLPL